MLNREVYVGLDYHQRFVQVCVLDGDGTVLGSRRCENQWCRIADYANGFGRVRRAAIEACCGSADLAEELVEEAGWSIDLAHPGYMSRMKRGPDKSDYTDARLAGDLTRVGYLPKVWLAPHAVREIRRLIRYRQEQAKHRRNTKLRIRALLREQRLTTSFRAWTRRWFAWLEHEAELSEQGRWVIRQHVAELAWVAQRLAEVEKRLTEVTKDDPVVARLLEQRGIGPVTAWTIRAEIGRFDRFATGKQLSRFCALSPQNASTGGNGADAGVIKAGSRPLRAVLIEAAHRLSIHDPRWRSFRTRMLAAGKPGSVIAVAIANRWMRKLYYAMNEAA